MLGCFWATGCISGGSTCPEHIKKQYSIYCLVDTMVDEDVAGFLMNEKPCRTLFAVQNLKDEKTYATTISKVIDTPYSHTSDILEKLDDLGLVESEMMGNRKMQRLTEEGVDLVEKLEPIVGDVWSGAAQVELEMKEESGTGASKDE